MRGIKGIILVSTNYFKIEEFLLQKAGIIDFYNDLAIIKQISTETDLFENFGRVLMYDAFRHSSFGTAKFTILPSDQNPTENLNHELTKFVRRC